MAFADHIFQTDKDEAAFWYTTGRLRALQDVKMCKDKTARAQVGVYPLMAPNTVKYLLKDNDLKYVYKTILKSAEWDENHSQRFNPLWACFSGMDAFNKKPELISMDEYKKVQEETRVEMIESIKKKLNH